MNFRSTFKPVLELFEGRLKEFVKSLESMEDPMYYLKGAGVLVVLAAVAFMIIKSALSSISSSRTVDDVDTVVAPSGETNMKFTKNMVGRSIRVQWNGSNTPTLEGRIMAVLSKTQITVKYEDDFQETIDTKAHRIELISRRRDMANSILRTLSPKKSKKN